jgi:peptide/nickel transport system permease protein
MPRPAEDVPSQASQRPPQRAESAPYRKDARPGLSFGRLAWRRFLSDRLAVAGGLFIILLLTTAAAAPLVAGHLIHHSPYQQHMMDTIRIDGRQVEVVDDDGLPVGPNRVFLLGADLTGRDVLSRIIYGARISLLVAILATGVSLFIGLVWGMVAAFYGGIVDTFLSRIMELMMAFPILLLAIALASAMQSSSLAVVILIIGFVNWTYVGRIVRGQVLSLRQREFVEAARALGAGDGHIMFRVILPNLVAPLIVYGTLAVAGNILFETALSFLGLGVQPPTPSWGNMIREGMAYYNVAWWITGFPGLFILLTVLAFNLMGDGLRDALDPHAVSRK